MENAHNSLISYCARNNWIFVTGSCDKSIKFWNASTAEYFRIIKDAHSNQVRALAMFDDDVLVSAGNDASLKFWNISNGQYLRNIENATKSIISSMILISDDTFATGSDDGSIIIWKN